MEIKSNDLEKSHKIVEILAENEDMPSVTSDITLASPEISTENQINVFKSSLDTAIGMIQEAPRFVFLFGSHLLSSIEGINKNEENTTEKNVFSSVKPKNQLEI